MTEESKPSYPENLSEFILFDKKQTRKNFFNYLLTLLKNDINFDEFERILCDDYNVACKNDSIIFEKYYGQDTVRIPTSFVSKSGEIIYACCEKNIIQEGSSPWVLRHFQEGEVVSKKISGSAYRRGLERFAYIRSRDILVEDLLEYFAENNSNFFNDSETFELICNAFDEAFYDNDHCECEFEDHVCTKVRLVIPDADNNLHTLYLYFVKTPSPAAGRPEWIYFSVGNDFEPSCLPSASSIGDILKNPRPAGKKSKQYTAIWDIEPEHSQGTFSSFIYTKSPEWIEEKMNEVCPIEQLIPEEYKSEPENWKYIITNKIIEQYIVTPDEEFRFTKKPRSVSFATGFKDENGRDIMLYATPNANEDKQPWFLNRFKIEGDIDIFEIVKAHVKRIEQDVMHLSNTTDRGQIVKTITKRNKDLSDILWLLDGVPIENQEDVLNPNTILYVPTGYYAESSPSDELYIYCKYKDSGKFGEGWYSRGITYANAPLHVLNKIDWLNNWADLVYRDDVPYSLLAQKAEQEIWTFDEKGYDILKDYLHYTFAYLYQNHQMGGEREDYGTLAFSDDEKWATFNTGLLDRRTHRFIYAVFERKRMDEIQKHPLHMDPQYRLYGYFTKVDTQIKIGNKIKYNVLRTEIRRIPMPASYFKDRKDTVWELSWDSTGEIQMPAIPGQHILDERHFRLPLSFYESAARCSPRFKEILEDKNTTESQKYGNIKAYLALSLRGDSEAESVYRLLLHELEAAMSDAFIRLAVNWRSVIPSYNPQRNDVNYLLPVSFSFSDKTDVVLVAARHANDTYQIYTLLTLEAAYSSARLVCRPEAEWLQISKIKPERTEMLEEDLED